MARIRSVHPGLFTDENYAVLSFPARELLKGLWIEADDNGIFEWKPLSIKMRVFPADAVDVPGLLQELCANWIQPFTSSGKQYGACKNFCKYQRPKKPKAVHPLPDALKSYVMHGYKPRAGEHAPDDAEEGETSSTPVPNQSATSTENAGQMEDGGGKREETIMSADADPSKPSAQPQSGKRNPYPEPFEAFWRDYPTDPLMSKKKAFAQWERLSPQDRDAARAAIPAFQSHCRKNPSYRPVHAERFISERRFDGFNAASAPPVDEGAAKALWGGDAAKLVEQIGAASFEAYFANVRYDPGPPARFAAPTPFIRDRIATKFASKIKAAYGEFELVTAQ